MKETRQQLLTTLINEAFAAINKLSEEITEDDLKWADENWETNDSAQQIINLAEDIIDSGKQFYLYED